MIYVSNTNLRQNLEGRTSGRRLRFLTGRTFVRSKGHLVGLPGLLVAWWNQTLQTRHWVRKPLCFTDFFHVQSLRCEKAIRWHRQLRRKLDGKGNADQIKIKNA